METLMISGRRIKRPMVHSFAMVSPKSDSPPSPLHVYAKLAELIAEIDSRAELKSDCDGRVEALSRNAQIILRTLQKILFGKIAINTED